MILMTVTLCSEGIPTVYKVRWKFFFCLQTVKCIVGSTQPLSVHLTVLNEKLATHSFHTICIYLFITNNICKDSVKEQGVEVPLRIQKILKLINIMLIYIYVYTVLYCIPETWAVIFDSTKIFPRPPRHGNASHPNHHVHDFSLKLMHKNIVHRRK